MIITLYGSQHEIRAWIRRQQRLTGKKLNYTGIKTDQEECVYMIQEGTKKDYPRQRIIKRFQEIDQRKIAEDVRKSVSEAIHDMTSKA